MKVPLKLSKKKLKPRKPSLKRGCSFEIEKSEFLKSSSTARTIVGVDEAGRGCLAGPVVVAGVIFDHRLYEAEIDDSSPLYQIADSKLLEADVREELAEWIKKNAAAYWIESVSHLEIDRINILQATFLGGRRVVEQIENQLGAAVDLILMDGPYPISQLSHRRQLAIVDGDQYSKSIAAASILAKVHRDSLMTKYAKTFPHFGFENNKGYGTAVHTSALRQLGPTEIHRKSFLKKYEHLILGTQAELQVSDYLRAQRFEIIERNWRTPKAEIDIVAKRDKEIHFFEVRARTGKNADLEMMFPQKKRERFLRAIEYYMSLHTKTLKNKSPRAHFVQICAGEIRPFWDAYQW